MAYDTWTIVEKDPPGPDGTVAVRIDLTGPGEPTERIGYVIHGGTTVRDMRLLIASESTLKASKSIADLITVGQTGSTSKPADPAPSAQDVWNAKVNRYLSGKALGSTNPTAIADLNALFADINATYQTSFL